MTLKAVNLILKCYMYLVKDLETELKKIMEEKNDAIHSQNFKRVTMHLCISLLDNRDISFGHLLQIL